ncbi:MAG: F0F1 ATP synthase subunit A [Deltaproteobacteria bacterium]|nr:MAG: F0F1 ATP synthase subunit A [Deltaproteobacteria bacterium]
MSLYHPLAQLGFDPVYQAVLLAALLLFLSGWLVRRQIAATQGGVVPDEGVTVRNALELIVEGLSHLARDNMGPDWRRWFPFVGTIFFFILISNLLGLVPGVGGATANVNTTTAWAIISFALYNYVGIRTHGWKYIKQFLGPIPALAWFFLLLEPPLHLARILTLSVRLLANMFADHTVVSVWLLLVPFAIPAVFMGLGLIVAVLQAFVFALLTMVYIGLAVEEAH